MEITRKSHVADAILLEFAGKEAESLTLDLPSFTAFDPDLNQNRVDFLKTNYQQAITYGTDKTEVGVLSRLTEQMAGDFRHCISIFKDVRYFARKRFGDSPAILKQLGLAKYWKARQTMPEMVVFMYELANSVEKYRSDLISAGLKESVIDSIKPAAEALERSNLIQENGKSSRAVKTEGRVELMNNIYDVLLQFSDAAKIIFANDPLKRDKYILPYSRNINGGAVADESKTQQA